MVRCDVGTTAVGRRPAGIFVLVFVHFQVTAVETYNVWHCSAGVSVEAHRHKDAQTRTCIHTHTHSDCGRGRETSVSILSCVNHDRTRLDIALQHLHCVVCSCSEWCRSVSQLLNSH